MCGIFGSPRFTPEVQAMLPYLGFAMLDRGSHAWGASNGYEMIHHTGPICKTWSSEVDRIATWEGGIFHTRAASVGDKDKLDNAHPFMETRGTDGMTIIGIHNGGISNHDELDRKYNRKCEVDSMHLWKHRAAGLSWSELRGSAALAWWETPADGTPPKQYLARINTPNIHIIQTQDGGYVWASTLPPLVIACEMVGSSVVGAYSLESEVVYSCTAEGLARTEERCPFGTFPVVSSHSHISGRTDIGFLPRGAITGASRGPDRTSNGGMSAGSDTSRKPLLTRGIDCCWKCRGDLVNVKTDFLCAACFQAIAKEFNEAQEMLAAVQSGIITQEEALKTYV